MYELLEEARAKMTHARIARCLVHALLVSKVRGTLVANRFGATPEPNLAFIWLIARSDHRAFQTIACKLPGQRDLPTMSYDVSQERVHRTTLLEVRDQELLLPAGCSADVRLYRKRQACACVKQPETTARQIGYLEHRLIWVSHRSMRDVAR